MINIATLNGGNISIVTGTPGPAGHPETRVKYTEASGITPREQTFDIVGPITGYYDSSTDDSYTTSQIDNIEDVEEIDLGNTVDAIGEYTFSYCENLTTITIPNTVLSIGDYAFIGCSELANVTIGDGVESIGYMAFSSCTGLTSVTIPNSVIGIGEHAFSSCWRLTSVTIPNSVTSIGEFAFLDCTGLTSVTIGSSVTSIEYEAFYGCIGLTNMTFNSFTKNEVKSLITSTYIFGETFYDDEGNPMEKSFTAICTDGSMTVHFSAYDPATITFTDL